MNRERPIKKEKQEWISIKKNYYSQIIFMILVMFSVLIIYAGLKLGDYS